MEKEQREEHGVERVVQEGVGTGSRQVIEEVDAAKVDQKWQMVNGGGYKRKEWGVVCGRTWRTLLSRKGRIGAAAGPRRGRRGRSRRWPLSPSRRT